MTTDPTLSGLRALRGLEQAQEACLTVYQVERLEELPAVIEKQACKLLNCEFATFFSLVGQGATRRLVSKGGEGLPPKSFPLSEGIIGTVARDLVDYICNDASDDPAYVGSVDGFEDREIQNLIATPMIESGRFVGVLQAINAPSRDFTETDVCWLHMLGEDAAVAYSRLNRAEEGWALVRNLAKAFGDILDERYGTVGHAERVRKMAVGLGEEMRLVPDEILELELATWLHQIGYIQLLPEAFHSERAETEEFRERLGSRITHAMLERLDLPLRLGKLTEIAIGTHGPGGTKEVGPEGSLAARILRVADAFDRMTSGHGAAPARKLSEGEAMAALRERAGKELDVGVVDRFVQGEFHKIERRRFSRYECAAPLNYSVLDEKSLEPIGDSVRTKTVDLAEGGVRFQSKGDLALGALLKVLVHLPSDVLEGYVRVARVDTYEGRPPQVGAYFIAYDRRSE